MSSILDEFLYVYPLLNILKKASMDFNFKVREYVQE